MDSQVIVLTPHAPEVEEEVFALVKQGFRASRKKVIHNLSGLRSKEELMEILADLGISKDARPGDLQLRDWARLKKVL